MRPVRQSNLATALLAGGLLTALVLVSGWSSVSGAPQHQPIDFFHVVHAGERQIECGFCHRTAESADYAGMPSTQLCMGCHRVVIPQSPEIWKLRSYWELGEPIPWIRVNTLPAHVFFSHKAHTAAAKIGCAACHGRVEQKYRLGQTTPLTMDWCLKCHRKQNASTECWSCHR